MKLTIGMIVKNEEKYLERCLSAIKPILDNVDSELIITDTGSTDRTVEIAEKYADKVLHFEWINDFSAARNTVFPVARGEWFMVLDADDIFESCDGIIDFFNSGEYRRYNSATYIGKNLCDDEGRYLINKQPRLTRILKNTKYVNAVHENLNTYGAPKKDISDVAVHYGYMYQDKDSAEKKYERNNVLLLKRYEKEKDTNAYLYAQLCENEMAHDNEKALEYAKAGIEVAKKLKSREIIALLNDRANVELALGLNKDAINTCDEYFRLDKTYRPRVLFTDTEMYSVRAVALYKEKNYSDAAVSYENFFKIHNEAVAGKLNTFETDITSLRTAADNNYIQHVIRYLICLCEIKQYEKAHEYIRILPVNKYPFNSSDAENLVSYELKIADHFDYDDINDYIHNLDNSGKKSFIKQLERILYYSPKKEQIISALNKIVADSFKIEIYSAYFNNKQVPLQSIANCWEKSGADEDPDLIMIAMDNQYDISPFIKEKNFNIEECVSCLYKSFYGFHKTVENYNVNNIESQEDLPLFLVFLISCMHCTYKFKSPKPGVFLTLNANKLLEKIGMIGMRLDTETLNDEMKAAVHIGRALEFRQRREYKDCIAELKNAVTIYEDLAKYVSDYSNEVVAEYNEFINTQKHGMSEMERLAAAIKNNIRRYIEIGDLENARKTINEYKSIQPDDPDINELEKLL